MFSISFLPWLLLLLGVLLSVPIVSFVESNRRKKALAAVAASESEAEVTEGEVEGDEVFTEDAGEGFPVDESPAEGGFNQAGDFGQAELAEFDDDTFK